MFLEIKNNKKQGKGWVEVVCGSMFSGKTEELIRRLRRAQIAKMKVEIFKPAMDIRYDEFDIVSHSEISIPSTPVENAQQILLMTSDVDVVGIDEVQFFDSEIVNVCNQLANKGTRVIVAGLDMDFQGNPFGVMPQLMAIAEYVSKVHAICVECGDLANFSHRLVDDEKIVMLGEKESYQPLCRKCYNDKNKDIVNH